MNETAIKIIARFFAYATLVYFIFSIIFFLLYTHPKRYISSFTPKDFGIDYQNIKLLTKDNIELDAWFVKKSTNAKAVILCHGYPTDKGNIFDMTRFLLKEYNLLYFDFRGMGKSGGFFTSGGYKETLDIKAAIKYPRNPHRIKASG